MILRTRPDGDLFAGVLALSLMFTANCGDGAATANSLVAVAPIPAGSTCQYGGVSLTSGVDVDTNGVLDQAEVSDTQTVCNGPQADPQVLVNTTMHASGSSLCTYGGTQIDTGLEVLDAELFEPGQLCTQIPRERPDARGIVVVLRSH